MLMFKLYYNFSQTIEPHQWVPLSPSSQIRPRRWEATQESDAANGDNQIASSLSSSPSSLLVGLTWYQCVFGLLYLCWFSTGSAAVQRKEIKLSQATAAVDFFKPAAISTCAANLSTDSIWKRSFFRVLHQASNQLTRIVIECSKQIAASWRRIDSSLRNWSHMDELFSMQWDNKLFTIDADSAASCVTLSKKTLVSNWVKFTAAPHFLKSTLTLHLWWGLCLYASCQLLPCGGFVFWLCVTAHLPQYLWDKASDRTLGGAVGFSWASDYARTHTKGIGLQGQNSWYGFNRILFILHKAVIPIPSFTWKVVLNWNFLVEPSGKLNCWSFNYHQNNWMQFNLYWQQQQQEEKQEEEEEEADCCVFCHWRHLGFQCCFSGGQRALHCIGGETCKQIWPGWDIHSVKH